MPKQKGPIILNGTLGNTTYYTRKGKHFSRTKSSLNKERVSKDPAFKNSRKTSVSFGEASTLASAIYRQLPQAIKKREVFNDLTRKSGALLRQGIGAPVVIKRLLKLFPKKAR